MAENTETRKIYGYIRNCENLLPNKLNVYYNIPELVYKICLLYYYVFEAFDLKNIGQEMAIFNDGKILKMMKDSCRNSGFLKSIIESGIHHWKFKILHCTRPGAWFSSIGIYKISDKYPNEPLPTSECFTQGSYKGYAIAASAGTLIEPETGYENENKSTRNKQ